MKRLIICADGTWNYRDQEDEDTGLRHATNVTKLARAVVPRTTAGIDQVVIYHDGVGTHDGLDRLLGGMTGEGIEANIRDLYRSIAYNYADGDELYTRSDPLPPLPSSACGIRSGPWARPAFSGISSTATGSPITTSSSTPTC